MNQEHKITSETEVAENNSTLLSELAIDTLKGLSANPKYLLSKYFYDDRGSAIFKEIMSMPEYYLTDCEMEILDTYKASIGEIFLKGGKAFNLIELGSGDGIKTKILLSYLISNNAHFDFIPIDISQIANDQLKDNLQTEFPQLSVQAKTGDYFQILNEIALKNGRRNIILFLGSNIGNLSSSEIKQFLTQLSSLSRKGDMIMIGFDLLKSPEIIMKAYNDSHGLTRKFNLNLLKRLNSELNAEFAIENFEQHTEYNPFSGEVKSFLVSKIDQTIHIENLKKEFHFGQWETVFIELSQKFRLADIEEMADTHGFKIEKNYLDSRKYFVDSLWEKI
jgi:L-histidine Nalpha-methyltransferase